MILLVSAGLLLRALDRAGEEGLVGLSSVALAGDLPLDLGRSTTSVAPEGWVGAEGSTRLSADFNQVISAYFETLGIPVLQGRSFGSLDAEGAEAVAVVSQTFADRVWPGEDVLGRRVEVFRGLDASFGGPRTIVGVVADVKSRLITDVPVPTVYLPLAQEYQGETYVVGRLAAANPTDAEIGAMMPLVREAILALDSGLSLGPFVALESYTRLGILPHRVAAGLTTALGLLAAFLAGLGIYGVVASAVTQRTREIGVRMALGAGRRTVRRMVVRDGFRLALPGLALGALGAVVAGYFLQFLLLGLSPADPISLIGVAIAILLVVTIASLIPGRRAASIEPMRALNSE